jgi:hypothetical protein
VTLAAQLAGKTAAHSANISRCSSNQPHQLSQRCSFNQDHFGGARKTHCKQRRLSNGFFVRHSLVDCSSRHGKSHHGRDQRSEKLVDPAHRLGADSLEGDWSPFAILAASPAQVSRKDKDILVMVALFGPNG